MSTLNLITKEVKEGTLQDISYKRSPDDEYLNFPKPGWYIEYTRRKPAEPYLDLSKIYSAPQYWDVSLVERDPGMPIFERHWSYNLIDNVSTLTSINLQKCNIGDRGLDEFSIIMKVNTTLKSINFKDNNFSAKKVNTFLDVLEAFNFTLVTLEIDEGKKTAIAKNRYQHDSVSVDSFTSEIWGQESEAELFREIQKRCQRISSWNQRVGQVIDGKTDKLELIFHEAKTSENLNARCHPGGSKGKEFRNERLALMLTMMPNLKSLTIDRWYPKSLKGSWFDELPPEEQQLREKYESKIPEELWQLPNLEELKFYDCIEASGSPTYFRHIPEGTTRLTKLRTLVISRCGMDSVEDSKICNGPATSRPFSADNLDHSVLFRLRSLQTLGIPGNGLRKIPETIGYCTSLTRLSIGNNKLEQLPDSILLLTNLKELWASDNYIWRLPISLVKYCPQLEDVRILSQGDDEKKSSLIPSDEKELSKLREAEKAAANSKSKFGGVVKYMKDFLASHKTIRLNRYKLVVVGDGAVGKTTTIRSLQMEAASAYKKKKNENILDNVATDGIAIQTLRLPSGVKRTPGYIGGNECINFSCWDFAGQDVYTYSHTFFMTEKSLYLIGFDCKGGDSSAGIERADYWLQVVRSRFPNACCILFGTHIDQIPKADLKVLQKKIQARYKSKSSKESKSGAPVVQKDLFRVNNIEFISNATGKGLPELSGDIKKFPSFMEKRRGSKATNEDEIPINWLMLEERGRAVGAGRIVPIISWNEWSQMALRDLNMDEVALKSATVYWHEVGSLSWFDEDGLRDIVCLRPDFLTDVFSAVISAKTGLSSGILRHDALMQIWKGLPYYLYPHMMTILEKFEILHRLEGGVLEDVGEDPWSAATLSNGNFVGDGAMNMMPSVSSSTPVTGQVVVGGVTLDFGSNTNPVISSSNSNINVNEASTSSPQPAVKSASPAPNKTQSLFTGRSIIPAMLPEQEPPTSEFEKAWPELPRGGMELVRTYTFDFVPNGFFARLLVKLLHSKWKASIYWRWGIVLTKSMARLFLKYDGRTRTMTLRVRGPQNVSKVGPLIDSISTLIQDWLPQADIEVKIPYTYPDGPTVEFDWKDLEKAAHAGKVEIEAPNKVLAWPNGQPNAAGGTSISKGGTLKHKTSITGFGIDKSQPTGNLPKVRLDNLAPDLALLSTSSKVFTEQELGMGPGHPPKELGRGGFAVVLRGQLSSGEYVACKKLIFDKSQEETGEMTFSDVFTEFRREVWLMSGLQHPNLVRLMGVCTHPNLMMVLEFMEGGTLHDFLHGTESTSKPHLTLDDRFNLALHVAKGMAFMHGMNPPIIHRDLKSPNILMTFRGDKGQKLNFPIPKIADFGLSRGLAWTSSMNDKVVDNPVWLAPEVIMKKPYNEKVDVYSYGVILYEIVTQQRFLEDLKFDFQKEDAVKNGKRPALPTDTNPVLASLVKFCWAQDPNQRPSFDQIVECLQTKTIIQAARPSILNYGTGFEELDEAPQAQLPRKESSMINFQVHADMIATAPPPLVAPPVTTTSDSSNSNTSSATASVVPPTPASNGFAVGIKPTAAQNGAPVSTFRTATPSNSIPLNLSSSSAPLLTTRTPYPNGG